MPYVPSIIEETRNEELENTIKSKGKKIIYVLNKSDLVDVKEKRLEAQSKKLFPFVFISCKKRQGSKELRNRIKIEVKKIRRRIHRT